MPDEYDEEQTLQSFIDKERQHAQKWARDILATDDWVILDSETTGLVGAEIVQIGVLSARGRVLLDALVKPRGTITPKAQQIHGITAEDVAGAVPFTTLFPVLMELVRGKRVLIYNADFDTGILASECERHGLLPQTFAMSWASVECVMLEYAAWCGDWNDYHEDFTWQKLPGGTHGAIGDCRAVLEVIKEMAKLPEPAVAAETPATSPDVAAEPVDFSVDPELPF